MLLELESGGRVRVAREGAELGRGGEGLEGAEDGTACGSREDQSELEQGNRRGGKGGPLRRDEEDEKTNLAGQSHRRRGWGMRARKTLLRAVLKRGKREHERMRMGEKREGESEDDWF